MHLFHFMRVEALTNQKVEPQLLQIQSPGELNSFSDDLKDYQTVRVKSQRAPCKGKIHTKIQIQTLRQKKAEVTKEVRKKR